jgi:iron complex transport system substrate-binding protein
MSKWLAGICFTIIVPLAVIAFFKRGDKIAAAPETYRRVVSLAPSMTETMIALGLAHALVGVTVHCDHADIVTVRRIGSFAEPNFEAIMAARPDLVLAVPHVMAKAVLDQIAAHGVEVFSHQPDSLNDIKSITTDLAHKFARIDDGKRVNEHIDRAILLAKNALYHSVTEKQRRSALIVVASSPFVVAGSATFASQIIEEMGMRNLASNTSAWPIWPLEKLIAEPPAFLILAGGNDALPSFQSLVSSLGLDLEKNDTALIVPKQPIFHSPSPAVINDIDYLTDLFLADRR